MEIRVTLPDTETPQTVREVMAALKAKKLSPTLQKKDWGDWIVFQGKETVISIESVRSLTTSATIESTEEEWEMELQIKKAFAKLGWQGEDEDGPYSLDY